jgi:hypothetical protein
MANVILIPTGRMEFAALGPALARLFPGHTFPSFPPTGPLDGFTSNNLATFTLNSPVAPKVDALASALVAAVAPGQGGKPADFAFVVEDLELVNDPQPELVIRIFREAVERHLQNHSWPSMRSQQLAYKAVRERCSFHLFRPMTEAYFFGEPAALTRVGAALSPQLAHSDWEQFLSSDTTFLGLPAGSDRVVDMPDRVRHPKSYLHYLCDPTLGNKKRKYKETKGGVAALSTLAWETVLTELPHCPFLHALLDDLAEAFHLRPVFVRPSDTDARTRYGGGPNPLLRNL